MKITFKKLRINNFKGIKDLTIPFSNEVIIKGMNATGKSTIFDAITWCLFGKNSQDAKDFNIKNTVQTELNRSDHAVELTLTVDDQEMTVLRVFKEKWTKRRGSEETEFTGHETLFFWNDVPCQAGEFQRKISELIPEQLFKQITNPLYFNTVMSWQSRRDALIGMAKEVTNEKVINGNKSYMDLFERLNGQKSLDEYRKEIAAKKTALKKAITEIPSRIDELLRSNPQSENWAEIEKEIVSKQQSIQAIDKEIEDIQKSFETQLSEIKVQQNSILEAKRKMSQIEIDARSKAYQEAETLNSETNRAKSDLSITRSELSQKKAQEARMGGKIDSLDTEIINLREGWTKENEKELKIDESKFVCPTCGVPYKEEDVEAMKYKMTSQFNASKQNTLTTISAEGKQKASEQNSLLSNIENITSEIKSLEEKEKSLAWSETAPIHQPKEINLSTNKEYQSLKVESEKVINVPVIDIATQKEMKLSIQDGIDELKNILAHKGQIDRNNARVDELKAEEKKYAQELASLEKQEFIIDSFNKEKMNLIESSINGKFKLVRFKLFNSLINGGEEPCCEVMCEGVPYSDLNHSAQINSGIDVINALSNHFNTYAPICIDNAECTNSFIESKSQTIRFYVTEDPELVITDGSQNINSQLIDKELSEFIKSKN